MTRVRERGKQRQGWMLRVAGPVGKETEVGKDMVFREKLAKKERI